MARLVISLLAVGLLFGVISCKSHTSVAAPPPDKSTAAADIAQADQSYAEREDLTRLEQGIVLLRQALTADPDNYDAAWRLAKFNYYLATHLNDNNSERAFRESIEAGKTAVKLQPDKPEGHFWLGANYGGALQSDTISGLASLEDVRKEMETVLKINEGYQDGIVNLTSGRDPIINSQEQAAFDHRLISDHF